MAWFEYDQTQTNILVVTLIVAFTRFLVTMGNILRQAFTFNIGTNVESNGIAFPERRCFITIRSCITDQKHNGFIFLRIQLFIRYDNESKLFHDFFNSSTYIIGRNDHLTIIDRTTFHNFHVFHSPRTRTSTLHDATVHNITDTCWHIISEFIAITFPVISNRLCRSYPLFLSLS